MDTVTVSDKKDFCKWFMNTYALKRRESVWILNYILSHDGLLEKLHFVEHAEKTSKGMIMSTHCMDVAAFLFYTDHSKSTDAEQAFHNIRRNRDDELYVTLEFRNKAVCPEWAGVLEDNPYHKEVVKLTIKDLRTVDSLLDSILFNVKLKALDEEIDQCLLNGTKDKFLDLSKDRKILMLLKPEKLYETTRSR